MSLEVFYILQIPPEILISASNVIVDLRTTRNEDTGLPLDLVATKLGEGGYNEIFLIHSVRKFESDAQ